eukprot:Clim_evm33s6 gene=Clim_evmTU33s6
MADRVQSNQVQTRTKHFEGWLLKWTNYVSGYRDRWFVLEDGVLTYYRSKEEMNHTNRGAILLRGATISHGPDRFSFIISTGAMEFYLRAKDEKLRAKWITVLELAKQRSRESQSTPQAAEVMKKIAPPASLSSGLSQPRSQDDTMSDDQGLDTDDDYGDDEILEINERAFSESLGAFRDALNESQQYFTGHGNRVKALHDKFGDDPEVAGLCKYLTLVDKHIGKLQTSCDDFMSDMKSQHRDFLRIQRAHERKKRSLEKALRDLARQHTALEVRAASTIQKEKAKSLASIAGDFDQDTAEFYDAMEQAEEEMVHVVMPTSEKPELEEEEDEFEDATDDHHAEKGHRRQLSTASMRKRTSEGDYPPLPVEPFKGERRRTVKLKVASSVSLWGVMKNCIGKDLSKIPMPVFFNEPTSFLQRLSEDLEYAEILHRAAEEQDTALRMALVACFTVSPYNSTATRVGKPFNPLLGETYEADRRADKGWWYVSEQVSHHPPISAMHAEAKHWTLNQCFAMSSKFRGKYLQIIPLNTTYLKFQEFDEEYQWRKVDTFVHNIIVGKLWVDNTGTMEITERRNGCLCRMKFHAYSFFASTEMVRRVEGEVLDSSGKVCYRLDGYWDKYMDVIALDGSRERVWQVNPFPPNYEKIYGFTYHACTLNELEAGVAPTDSRLRPDQRLMEEGELDRADQEKHRLEEKQRASRRKREETGAKWQNTWFEKVRDNEWVYKGGYWEMKADGNWKGVPDIF